MSPRQEKLHHSSTSGISESVVEDQDANAEPAVDGKEPESKVSEACKDGRLICVLRSCIAFYKSNDFPINLMLAIALARAYPPLGAEYLKPDITSTWLAVAIIFVLSGMGLRTEELGAAFQRMHFNGFVQLFNFGVVSIVVYAVSRFLATTGILNQALADGMVICSALPMAINIVIVLTASAKGDEAAAIFNATFGNIIGIFLSPVLILLYLGTSGDVSLGTVFYRLTLRVIVPLVIGQVVQKLWVQARDFYRKHKRIFKKIQELSLIFIVYCGKFYATVVASVKRKGPSTVTYILYLCIILSSLLRNI